MFVACARLFSFRFGSNTFLGGSSRVPTAMSEVRDEEHRGRSRGPVRSPPGQSVENAEQEGEGRPTPKNGRGLESTIEGQSTPPSRREKEPGEGPEHDDGSEGTRAGKALAPLVATRSETSAGQVFVGLVVQAAKALEEWVKKLDSDVSLLDNLRED